MPLSTGQLVQAAALAGPGLSDEEYSAVDGSAAVGVRLLAAIVPAGWFAVD